MEKEKITELVQKSQAGNQEALAELLCAAHTSVSYQCRKMLKNAQDAEDVTQEVLITLYQKLDTLQEPAAFWGWLSRITANRCKNALVRTHVDLQIPEDEDGHSMLDDIENTDKQLVPDEAIDNAETMRMVEEIVDALPEAQRMCTLLFYYDEMSVKEIAEVMGTSENTVKSRLNYARKALKESVLTYEKKQGIRLHSLSPIPFLFYFLHKSAEANANPAAAQETASRILSASAASTVVQNTAAQAASSQSAVETSAVSAQSQSIANASVSSAQDAAGTSAASSSAVSSAGTAASHIFGGISLKIAAAGAVGLLLIGGSAAGIYAVIHSNEPEAVAVVSEEIENSSDEEASEAVTEAEVPAASETPTEPEAETALVLNTVYASQLPYTGEIADCAMTQEQAEAFAAVLEDCIAQSQTRTVWEGVTTFCRAALFDAGDGIPALFVAGGIDMNYEYNPESGYMPDFDCIYYWDGSQAVLAAGDPDGGLIASESFLTDDGLLFSSHESDSQAYITRSFLYPLAKGMIADTPQHVYERIYFMSESDNILSVEIPSAETVRSALADSGYYGNTYNYDTLAENCWRSHESAEDDGFDGTFSEWASCGWWLGCLDGTFLSGKQIEQTQQVMTWWSADWKLGHGDCGASDVSHAWRGIWGDAAELAELLRGDSSADDTLPASGNASDNGSVSISTTGNIRRATLNTGYDNLEIFYEIPVFDESGPGFQKINAFFENQQEEFFSPENEDISAALEIVEMLAEYPATDRYYYVTSARINDQTAQLVSVSLLYNWYMGGSSDYGSSNYNFRPDTGEQIYLTDLLDCSEEEIREMVVDALNADYGLETYLPESVDAVRNYDVKDFDFFVSDGEIHVCFDKYEIAYGSAGSFDVVIPTN